MWHIKLTRDAILFVLGATGFLHELFFPATTDRPFILTVSAALMGLPLILRAEESTRDK